MRLSIRIGGGRRDASAGMRPAFRGCHSARLRVALAGFCAGMLGVLVVAAPADASAPQPVTCGQTITAPGQYFLASDCSGSGIGIGANDVRLRLAGHTMDGMGCSFSTGIESGSVAGLRIQGPGTITGYFVGISLNGANDSRVQKVTLSDDCDDGVLASGSRDQFTQNVATGSTSGSGFQVAGTDNRYVNNTADHNSGSGIALQPASKNNRIMGNQATNNGRFGIAVFSSATDNTIRANTANSNGSFDLADFNAGCDSNTWSGNRFGTANESCIN